VGGG